MNQAAWLGLLIGTALGAGYAWSQARSLRRLDAARQRGEPPPLAWQFSAAVARLGFLAVALAVVALAPSEKIHKWWLTGSLAVFYSVPLFWQVRRMVGRKA